MNIDFSELKATPIAPEIVMPEGLSLIQISETTRRYDSS